MLKTAAWRSKPYGIYLQRSEAGRWADQEKLIKYVICNE